ncbi:MAG: hypothetical protein AB7P17_07345 [Nitrospirales bacterium]|nr:hypothetical protein [Nitrospirales bacterium]
MKTFSRVGTMVLIMGCQGAAPTLSGAGENAGELPRGSQAIQAESHSQKSQYLNIEGRLKEIHGDMYILEGTGADQTVRVHVGGDTAFPNGQKEPGQAVQALVVAKTGHALIIR